LGLKFRISRWFSVRLRFRGFREWIGRFREWFRGFRRFRQGQKSQNTTNYIRVIRVLNQNFNSCNPLQFDIIRYRRYYREYRYLFCLNLNISINRAAGLIEINEIRIFPAVSIVDAEHPFPFYFT